jgi:uncharacterized protein
MMPAVITGDLGGLPAAFFFLGVFGPASAGAIVTRATGASIRGWLREIFKFRLLARLYIAAIGVPVVLAVVASAGFALAGESLDFGLAGERAAAFVPLFVFCLLLNGGPEEPGWRGFALPTSRSASPPFGRRLSLAGSGGCGTCRSFASRTMPATTSRRFR